MHKKKSKSLSMSHVDSTYRIWNIVFYIYRSDGRVVRASASGAADTGLIPSRVKLMIIKLVFTTSLFDAQH